MYFFLYFTSLTQPAHRAETEAQIRPKGQAQGPGPFGRQEHYHRSDVSAPITDHARTHYSMPLHTATWSRTALDPTAQSPSYLMPATQKKKNPFLPEPEPAPASLARCLLLVVLLLLAAPQVRIASPLDPISDRRRRSSSRVGLRLAGGRGGYRIGEMGGAVSGGCAGAAGAGAEGEGAYTVVLNVYDLTPLNNYLHWCGLGIFHSAVEGEPLPDPDPEQAPTVNLPPVYFYYFTISHDF